MIVIEKNTLKRLSNEFIFTTKDTKRNKVKVLLQVQNRVQGLIVEDERRHVTDHVTCSEKCITPNSEEGHYSEGEGYKLFQLGDDFSILQHHFVVVCDHRKFGGQHSGYHTVEMMNIIGVEFIGFAPNLITCIKCLLHRLKIGINREPNGTTQRGVRLLLMNSVFIKNACSLSGQVIDTSLTMKPKLDSGCPGNILGKSG